MTASSAVTTFLLIVAPVVGLLFAVYHTLATAAVSLEPRRGVNAPLSSDNVEVLAMVRQLTGAISKGAHSFLYQEYLYLGVFMFVFFFIILGVVGAGEKDIMAGFFAAIAFVFGGATSILSGLLGMKIAVYANGRTAVSASRSIGEGFRTAFRAGAVMGFCLSSMGILVLFVLIQLLKLYYSDAYQTQEGTVALYTAVTGYGLGGSSIALFGRVGGGIYTKAADVGADLVGKIEQGIPEDDIRNPATIADNVGDNVGDIAGMGADLFGSFAEATCAAMVIAANSELHMEYTYMSFPIMVSAIGILVCIVTSFVASHLMVVRTLNGAEPVLKMQLVISTVLMTPAIIALCYFFLPSGEFSVDGRDNVTWWYIALCTCCGLWSGLVIGYITEYYTSNQYAPVMEVSQACETGAATNIIYGLALGYKSVIIPVFCLALTIYVSFSLAHMFGIAMAAIGILSTMSIGLTIDAYGPIADNAGGIAEMAEMGKHVRDNTDALDAAGNTTAAIGKGFAIASAALVSLALFGGFVTQGEVNQVDLLDPFVFAGLLVGAMLPYWFSAMTMKSVGVAALAMVKEVRRQFKEIPGIMERVNPPDYESCVKISTDASLREMLPPGALVIITPIVTGLCFGKLALAGLLAGALVSGVQMAISASNTGGAWDNAKKYYEARDLKGTPEHTAAVVGDTVGDPLKDTSGPALNILIKLMAIISLVFVPAFPHTGYVIQLFEKIF